ncbi:hypothetical protein [Mycobacterium sp.]|uniref:hypothetical protein n=1 Tax=Mycobacterium sp. TaxID=1785 RepID=UPI002CF8F668|nr:hypothetical protein [Mycobacterium sp.]HKP42105.1 hypothetical protein [Mycobacterium sp.]
MASSLSDDDVRKFLSYLYFGDVQDEIDASIRRAYRDFSRTLHGLGKYVDRSRSKAAAREVLRDSIRELTASATSRQDEFDAWHKNTCDELRASFGDFHVYYGQAQKWINMSLKYLFILDRSRIAPYWDYCHVPVDNILLGKIAGHEPPRFGCWWSRIDDYQRYRHFQDWFRNEFPGAPMDNEWRLWLGAEDA